MDWWGGGGGGRGAILELETLVWNLATFDGTGQKLVTTQGNIASLGKRTNFYAIFLAMRFISPYDAI